MQNIYRKTIKYSLRILNIIFPESPTTILLKTVSLEELYSKCTKQIDNKHNIKPIFYYRDKLVRDTIWELKYRKNKDAIRIFSKLLYEQISKDFDAYSNIYLIPVPTHWFYKKERGYNQCELICREISKINPNLKTTNIISKKYSKKQSRTKNKHERFTNIRGKFKLIKDVSITNGTYIIIDDVFTTGGTIKEIRKVLLNAGAKDVRAYTLAH